MSEPTPNPRQRELIENTDGLFLVDAGAGTGKTFAITHRYAEIVDQPAVEPDDVLLVTFTRSAATEMKERIVDHSSYSVVELADAPIQTFHSLCADLLREHGHRAPTHLGIDDHITGSTDVVEDGMVESHRFREFIDGFRADHPEHADLFRVLGDGTELKGVIDELAAKGVFPTADGWYRDGESVLDGDFEAFSNQFDAVNEPRNEGSKQSRLREKLNSYGRNRTYLPGAPEKSTLRGDGTKQVPERTAELAFEEDRAELKALVHDVYFEYLDFALSRNYLTFGFLQLFAFVVLRENAGLRERVAFEYVMVDEFQDTSEIQCKLTLLLAGRDNLCVVGDWKQSIYGFQYADVDNIRQFRDRLSAYAADLNDDGSRVSLDADAIETIELTENYRSTQTLLDFAKQALVTPAKDSEDVDETVLDDVVSLSANAPFDRTTIEGFQHPDEHEVVLTAIQDIVGNAEYAIEDEAGEPTPPSFGDIAVLTRTRDFGRELLSVAAAFTLPMAYDGGVELFRTDQAKLLLAWLRILEGDEDRGWAVVLEEAGYELDQVKRVLETGEYPTNLVDFRAQLAAADSVGSVARQVFDRYGFTGEYADVLLETIQSLHDGSTLPRGDLVRFIERGIENGTTAEVSTSAGVDSVTVQTIHAAKGLEYPIVILANMNDGAFPPKGGSSSTIRYDESTGLRQRRCYADIQAHPHVYDNWTHDVLRHCRTRDFDEERRLLYVALTRAEHHVVLAGGETPNTFYEQLPFDERSIDPAVTPETGRETVQAELPFTVVPPDGPIGHTPHTLMDESVFEDETDTLESDEVRGRAFGSRVHDFAEAYAVGEDVVPRTERYDDEGHVREFIDGLAGELHVEERAVLPLTVDGEQVTITGVVDLVHETDRTVEIVDYKTDLHDRAESEYRKQLSIYYHVIAACFPEKEVSASLFYTATGERRGVEPLAKTDLEAIVRKQLQV